ncbi:MAG TPA: hypothetical protein VF746_15610 [Longimicrobium sp.]|jgi:hypothetical protein
MLPPLGQVLLSLVAALTASPDARAPGAMCSVDPPIEFSVARTRRIVNDAEVVVRAVAVGSATPGRRLKAWDYDTLAFEVREVLKGENVSDTIYFGGVVTEHDDFQEGPVPYLSHRTLHAAGDCINAYYRIGAEYLLLLGRVPGNRRLRGLTPYWTLLAPTNEQLRGPDDPWLLWVREQVGGKAAAPTRP